MLSGKILDSSATLNNFREIGSLDFIPGEEITVFVRIFDDQLDLRFIPAATNITTLTLNNADGTTLSKTGSHLTDDRSIFSFSLSETETSALIGGNIIFDLDILGDGTQIRKGIILNALSKIVDGDC